MTTQTKTCSRCGQTKPLDDFKSDSRKPDGKASSCKVCVAVPKVGDIQAMRSQLVIATPHEIMPPALMNDAAAWALLINARWRESAEKIIDAGRYLIAAKAALPHGDFGAMIETQLAFSASTAQRLMAIAADGRLSNPAHVQHLPPSWGTLYEITKLSDDEFHRAIEQQIIRPDMERREVEKMRPAAHGRQSSDGPGSRVGDKPRPHGESLQQGLDTSSKPGTVDLGPQGEGSDAANVANPEATSDRASHVLPGPSETLSLPNGARAIMGSRQEPGDSLDFFPTPPWATRALLDHVLAHLERKGHCRWQTVWEPACGEGHMAEPLKEYFKLVFSSDIHDYGYSAHGIDFLGDEPDVRPPFDWIITNPPFGDTAEAFVLKAIDLAGTGVAMFMRVQWLDTIGRYERIFRDHPPTLIAFFAERVPLCKGRWEPKGSTATAYMWLVWIKGAEPRAPFWIPPGQREALTKPGDIERFGAAGSDVGTQSAPPHGSNEDEAA
jgi:hypothetical protein